MNMLITCKNIKASVGKAQLNMQNASWYDCMPSEISEFLNALIDHAQNPTACISGLAAVDVVPGVVTPFIVIGPMCFGQYDYLEVLSPEPQAQFIKPLCRHLACIPVKTTKVLLILVPGIASCLILDLGSTWNGRFRSGL